MFRQFIIKEGCFHGARDSGLGAWVIEKNGRLPPVEIVVFIWGLGAYIACFEEFLDENFSGW
jgi:hypothetical protein